MEAYTLFALVSNSAFAMARRTLRKQKLTKNKGEIMVIKIVEEKSRVLEFGKIDYHNIGRKINAVSVNFGLKVMSDGTYRFSVCGDIWNLKRTDVIHCGQCLDAKELDKLAKEHKSFALIRELWSKYHLNDLHAGTKEQEEALAMAYEKGALRKNSDYDERCEYLKSIGLYEVKHKGSLYRYGSAWLFSPIPDDALEQINLILDKTKSILELDALL